MIVSSLFIYPIKSLPGVAMEEAVAQDRGLEGDRRWMLVDDSGRFISLREERKMAAFEIREAENNWIIGQGGQSLRIPKELSHGLPLKVTIWEDEVEAWKGEDNWDSWFSMVLERPCRLVYMPVKAHRPVKKQWQLGKEEVSFADGYPYLIVNERSLRDLEEKTKMTMDVRRFRPNLVLSGGDAYDEFLYRELAIGEAILNGLKPCERCVVVTLDPETGVQDKEPLKTLAQQRVNGKAVFGQHASLLKSGMIRRGDEVHIKQYKESPYDPL
jgi:uncharacterized protein YcbX